MAFSSISYLWNKWNIRSFVLLSLSLQVFLILFSPIRKKTANRHIIFLLWLAYLLADWVAAFTIGLISHNQGNLFTHATEVDKALQAFWASFLLLHLGGPDTITAFSLEDSSLWRRHLLSLIFQIGAAIYVFAQIFPSDRLLIIPTMLVFLVGVIKNAERTLALNLSSLPRLREWVLSPQEAVICLDNHRFEKFRDPRRVMLYLANEAIRDFKKDEANYNESTVVELAYCFFEIFRVFLGDLMFTRKEREISRNHFALMSAMDMLSVMSVELQFIYEVLHTKALAIRSKLSYIFRFISFMGVVVAFILFNRLKKHQLAKVDVKITYILLFGGIVLDVIALFMLIFSDWRLAEIMLNNSGSSKLYSLLYDLAYDTYKKPRLATYKAEPDGNVTYEALDTPIIFRRWSESISACNLLSIALKKSPRKMRKMCKCDLSLGRIASSKLFNFPFPMVEKIISYFHQAGETIARGCGLWTTEGVMLANARYVSKNPFLTKLWFFIVKEVRCKSESMCDLRERRMRELTKMRHGMGIMDPLTERRLESRPMDEPAEARRIFEARGDLFLESLQNDYGDLLQEFTEANYDGRIIMWHIATEIWYNIEKSTEERDEGEERDDFMEERDVEECRDEFDEEEFRDEGEERDEFMEERDVEECRDEFDEEEFRDEGEERDEFMEERDVEECRDEFDEEEFRDEGEERDVEECRDEFDEEEFRDEFTKERDEGEFRDKREFSKILSDYMLYLFLNQPNVVSAVVGIAQTIAGETLDDLQTVLGRNSRIHDVEGLCRKLYDDPQAFSSPIWRSKSVLKQGTTLARKMADLGETKWEVMSGVWVEMLSYAAIHIKGEAHVQVLSKGGELLTFIWLLIAHFGCVYKPELGIYYQRYGKNEEGGDERSVD